jgi:hypothetical protein
VATAAAAAAEAASMAAARPASEAAEAAAVSSAAAAAVAAAERARLRGGKALKLSGCRKGIKPEAYTRDMSLQSAALTRCHAQEKLALLIFGSCQ